MDAAHPIRRQFNLRSLFLFTFLIGLNLVGAMTLKGTLLVVTAGATWIILAARDYPRTAVIVLLVWMFCIIPFLICMIAAWLV